MATSARARASEGRRDNRRGGDWAVGSAASLAGGLGGGGGGAVLSALSLVEALPCLSSLAEIFAASAEF